MDKNPKYHLIAIQCKSCETNWGLNILLSGNNIEPFATICDCGALIIGNFNFHEYHNTLNSISKEGYSKSKIYLTNGHFEILQMSETEILTLPNLPLE